MIITITGVAIGVAVFLSIQLANRQTLRSFEESVNLVLGRADAVIHAEGMTFDEKLLRKTFNVVRKWVKAYPVIEGYGIEAKSGEVVEILGTDLLQDSGIRDFSLKTVGKDLKGLLPIIMDPRELFCRNSLFPEQIINRGTALLFSLMVWKKRLT